MVLADHRKALSDADRAHLRDPVNLVQGVRDPMAHVPTVRNPRHFRNPTHPSARRTQTRKFALTLPGANCRRVSCSSWPTTWAGRGRPFKLTTGSPNRRATTTRRRIWRNSRKEGLRFTQAYAPAPMCTPTRAAILTGKTPAALHVTTPGGGRSQVSQKLLTPPVPRTKIEDGETTIAEALKEVGYATAHLGKWHLGQNSSPEEHGFDFHDGNTENDGPGQFEDPNPKDIFGITERAVGFMREQVQRNKPFYLHLSHYAVHQPTLARESTVATFDNLPRGTRHTDAAYAAMTFDLDASIGMVLAEIEKLGVADNTYVIFMSDNGAPGGPRRRAENQPLAGGKSQLYEGGIRVPFIARGPGIPAGAICREAITGCDLLPTYCEWAGISCPESVDGTSLVPLLKSTPASFERKEPSLLFHFPHYGVGRAVPQSALVIGKYKIVRNYEFSSVELFDLAEDLSESDDLANTLPETAKELEALLDDRLKRADAQMTSPNPDYDPNASVTQGRRGGPRGRERTATPRHQRP